MRKVKPIKQVIKQFVELEYIIYVKLEDGSKEEILMWADEDCSRDELSALAHEKVMNKFGDYSEFRVELN